MKKMLVGIPQLHESEDGRWWNFKLASGNAIGPEDAGWRIFKGVRNGQRVRVTVEVLEEERLQDGTAIVCDGCGLEGFASPSSIGGIPASNVEHLRCEAGGVFVRGEEPRDALFSTHVDLLMRLANKSDDFLMLGYNKEEDWPDHKFRAARGDESADDATFLRDEVDLRAYLRHHYPDLLEWAVNA